MPLHISIKKVMKKMLNRSRIAEQRRIDLIQSTYCKCPEWLIRPSNNIIEIRNIPLLRDYEKEIIKSADNSVNHRFDLLGSGPVKVHYGMEANGWEGIKYTHKVYYENTLDLLKRSVTPANFEHSSEILSHIPPGYEPIDWQIDFKSGYRWNSLDWSPDIRYGDVDGADIKLPWEIGRMQHLPALAFAAILQNNKDPIAPNTYLREIECQILDFIAFNPPRFGTQWMTSMDVAIRAVNWILTYNLIVNAGLEFPDYFTIILKESIYTHGEHIMANLEWSSGMRGNHYLSNIIGMLYISTYLPDSAQPDNKTDSWLIFALRELANEILYQFNEDGGNFEASTAYHLFTSEMVFFALRLIEKIPAGRLKRLQSRKYTGWIYNIVICNIVKSNILKYSILKSITKLLSFKKQKLSFNLSIDNGKLIFSPKVIGRLNAIIKFTTNLSDAKGNIPQIGDNDSGYLLRLTPTASPLDANIFRSLLNPDFRTITGRQYIETELAFRPYNTDTTTAAAPLIKFADFGLYIYIRKNYRLIIRCGDVGQKGKGGHSHNDQLSFVFNHKGEDFFVDPGTYVYTASAEMRNKYRSTKSHNTLIINNVEQNTWYSYSKDDLFWIAKNKAKATPVSIKEHSFIGVHNGYKRRHKREFQIFDDCILINDTCEVRGVKLLKYHLYPDVIIESVSESNVLLNRNGIMLNMIFDSGRINIDNYRYSPRYGKVEKANVVTVEFEENSITTKLNLIR